MDVFFLLFFRYFLHPDRRNNRHLQDFCVIFSRYTSIALFIFVPLRPRNSPFVGFLPGLGLHNVVENSTLWL